MMDNEDTVTDLTTGTVVPFMYMGEEAEDGFEIDDTVNIPRGEYEELLYESEFLSFLEDTVGPEVWENAQAMFEAEMDEEEQEPDG